LGGVRGTLKQAQLRDGRVQSPSVKRTFDWSAAAHQSVLMTFLTSAVVAGGTAAGAEDIELKGSRIFFLEDSKALVVYCSARFGL